MEDDDVVRTNPFPLLLPELWQLIRTELMTPTNAVARVRLQRTCKAAHVLDPGLILAPCWHGVWTHADPEMKVALLFTLQRMHRNKLFEKAWCPALYQIHIHHTHKTDRVPRVRVTWILNKTKHVYLDYYPHRENKEHSWGLGLYDTHRKEFIFTRLAPTLNTMLKACPFLLFGVADYLMEARSADEDLTSLFVCKNYR